MLSVTEPSSTQLKIMMHCTDTQCKNEISANLIVANEGRQLNYVVSTISSLHAQCLINTFCFLLFALIVVFPWLWLTLEGRLRRVIGGLS